jgi:hypothetical protein
MRLELTASIPGVAVLEVSAVLDNGVVLRRLDAGRAHEAFYLVEPEREPGAAAHTEAAGLPLLFHRDGGFWRADAAGGEPTPLAPGLRWAQFSARPYPEMRGGSAAPVVAGRALPR